ncbi:MAG: hypothetical protein WHV61_03270 [Burkholderiales bacterium]
MGRTNPHLRQQMRMRIAQAAARLMAEDGIQDYALAKRKAARQLGGQDTHSLPTNAEIEEALRAYQSLYQGAEQAERLRVLRLQACAVMRLMERFNPHLTGSVLTGTAARHSDINLMLFTDSDKDVELFLLNAGLPYQRGEKRYRFGDSVRVVPAFTLQHGGPADVNLAVFPTDAIRESPRSPVDGRALPRARLAEVEALLA